jgi:23S rRNA maturation mini-RNase III
VRTKLFNLKKAARRKLRGVVSIVSVVFIGLIVWSVISRSRAMDSTKAANALKILAKKAKVSEKEAIAAEKKSRKIISAMDFYQKRFALAFKDGKYGFIDQDGDIVIDYEYAKGEPFNAETGYAEMGKSEEKLGEIVNTKYLIEISGNRYQLINVSEVLNEDYLVKFPLSRKKHEIGK